MEFEFQIEYDTEDMIALNRAVVKLYRRRRVWIMRTICFLAALCQLVVGILLLTEEGFHMIPVMNLLLAVLFFAFSCGYHRINAWGSKRMLLKDTGTIFVSLVPEGIREKSAKGESLYPYSAITAVCRCRGRYILLLDRRHGIILSGAALVSGSPEALGDYLTEQCSLPIQEIR